MFTGIIEALGEIAQITKSEQGLRLDATVDGIASHLELGESVAVNGVCLTVVSISGANVSFDVSDETLSRTSLSQFQVGTRINLERPVTLQSRLGGHLVQGHVDATGVLQTITAVGDGFVIRISFPEAISRYIVEKGSITVDGISLTVAALGEDWFEVAIIPHTWKVTNLSSLSPGSPVNLEVDVIAKYVERLLMHPRQADASMD